MPIDNFYRFTLVLVMTQTEKVLITIFLLLATITAMAQVYIFAFQDGKREGTKQTQYKFAVQAQEIVDYANEVMNHADDYCQDQANKSPKILRVIH